MSKRPVAFVTGASRGIGRGIAIELAGCGYDVVGCATSYDPADQETGLAEVKQRAEELGAAFEPVCGDISDLATHKKMLDAAVSRFKEVDLLVNNAGIAPAERADILEATPESFDRVFSVNTRGTFFLAQIIARHMAERKRNDPGAVPRAAIIFISSISSEVSTVSRAEYCMSKAAISGAARVFAHRLAEDGINVYDVRPGITRTDMTAPSRDKYDVLISEGLVPQKRWGEPADVAKVVAALARGDFSYSTGLVVEVSGGMQIRRL